MTSIYIDAFTLYMCLLCTNETLFIDFQNFSKSKNIQIWLSEDDFATSYDPLMHISLMSNKISQWPSIENRLNKLTIGYVRQEMEKCGVRGSSIGWDTLLLECVTLSNIRCREKQQKERPINGSGQPRTPPSPCSSSCFSDLNYDVLEQIYVAHNNSKSCGCCQDRDWF